MFTPLLEKQKPRRDGVAIAAGSWWLYCDCCRRFDLAAAAGEAADAGERD